MKFYFSIFLFISLITNEIYSLTLVNNASVRSDILSEIFIEEINKNPTKIYQSSPDYGQYNSEKCLSSLREITNNFRSPVVAQFFDAWGNIPSGVLNGNLYDLGNYDQCVATNTIVRINESFTPLKQQYCFAEILINDENLTLPNIYHQNYSISIGICAPHSCSPDLLTSIFKESTKDKFNGALSGISVGRCSDGQIPSLTAVNIAGLSVFGVLSLLMILSSAYEVYTSYCKLKPNEALMAYSIMTNGKKLFAINTNRSRSSFDCLTGMRVISTLSIIHFHIYVFYPNSHTINNSDYLENFNYTWKNILISNTNIPVDTFLFMGGFLVAWIGFQKLDKTNGKINFLMNIVHRYIRLTPILIAGLLLSFCINNLIYTGPFKTTTLADNVCNTDTLWPILLYIQNYYTRDLAARNCNCEVWYLAVDFQLYALSPLILVPMWKWGRKFAPVLVILVLLSIGWAMGVYFTEHYTGLILGSHPDEWKKVYVPTHTRIVPWVVGFGLGYFMHKNRQSQFKLPKFTLIVGWTLSFFTLVGIIFGTYFSKHANGNGTVFEAAMYEGLKRISWASAHAWITFACYYGYGGIVDGFLSHPIWQPFGRLSYAMYLMHMTIARIHFGSFRTEMYFSFYNQFLTFFSTLGVTFFVAVYVTLAFESPILILEKLIFTKQTPTARKTDEIPEPLANFDVQSTGKKL